jgi:hypothetical protein
MALQDFKDWYVLSPKDFYNKYIDKFWKRIGLTAVSGDHGFLDMDPLPLGYSEVSDEMMQATHRKFEKIAKKYLTLDDHLKIPNE